MKSEHKYIYTYTVKKNGIKLWTESENDLSF